MGLVVLLVRPRSSLGDVAVLQPVGDLVIDELRPAVRIENHQSNGKRSCSSSMPSRIHFEALLRIEQFSVQPITRSVIVSVRANSPIRRRAAVRHGVGLDHPLFSLLDTSLPAPLVTDL